jgi:hypothetical protein
MIISIGIFFVVLLLICNAILLLKLWFDTSNPEDTSYLKKRPKGSKPIKYTFKF